MRIAGVPGKPKSLASLLTAAIASFAASLARSRSNWATSSPIASATERANAFVNQFWVSSPWLR